MEGTKLGANWLDTMILMTPLITLERAVAQPGTVIEITLVVESMDRPVNVAAMITMILYHLGRSVIRIRVSLAHRLNDLG